MLTNKWNKCFIRLNDSVFPIICFMNLIWFFSMTFPLTFFLIFYYSHMFVSRQQLTSAFLRDLIRICTVSSNVLPVILPSFSYIAPRQAIAALKYIKIHSKLLLLKILIKFNVLLMCNYVICAHLYIICIVFWPSIICVTMINLSSLLI